MRKLGVGVGLLVIALVALAVMPARVDPKPYVPTARPPAEGPFAPNERLKGAEWLARDLKGPESLCFDAQGNVVTGLADGRVVSVDDKGQVTQLVQTGGRPLGVKYDANGVLHIADGDKGLLALKGGQLSVLATSEGGVPFRLTDDLVFGVDGKVYFTDASTRFRATEYIDDIIEHQTTGRVLTYDPSSGKVTRIADGLSFANGIAIGSDPEWAVVSETGANRLWKVWLDGSKKEVFSDALPGFPDNITYSASRRVFWVALFGLRDPLLDALATWPMLRKIISHFPPPPQKPMSYVLAVGEDGKPIESLQYLGSDGYFPVTSAIERDGHLYLGSLVHSGFARVKL